MYFFRLCSPSQIWIGMKGTHEDYSINYLLQMPECSKTIVNSNWYLLMRQTAVSVIFRLFRFRLSHNFFSASWIDFIRYSLLSWQSTSTTYMIFFLQKNWESLMKFTNFFSFSLLNLQSIKKTSTGNIILFLFAVLWKSLVEKVISDYAYHQ